MSNKYRLLLIVEDELKIAEVIRDYMQEHFEKVHIIGDGDEVIDYISTNLPDFVILDIMLPGLNGFEICKKIRQNYNIPILFLTARSSEIDRILGLEFGADDYVVKPFSVREVVARVKTILKRTSSMRQTKQILNAGGIVLDPNRQQVVANGKQVSLTTTEFDILEIMMKQPNFVFERGYFVHQVMGYEYDGYERNVDAHIKNIRRKFAAVGVENKIESIYGVGYKFIDS